VAQSKFSRQSIPDRWSRDIEGASCQIGVGSRDDHLQSVGRPIRFVQKTDTGSGLHVATVIVKSRLFFIRLVTYLTVLLSQVVGA